MRRSGRIGGASGSGTLGYATFFVPRGARGGNRRSFADEEAISDDAERCVMMEASPSSSLEMREAEFAFQLLLVAFDAPTKARCFREPGRVGRFWPNKANAP